MLSRSRGSFCSRFVLAKEMMKSAAEAFFSHSMRSSPLSALLQGPISLICSLRTQMVRDAQAQKHRGPMLRVGGHDTASSVCLHPHIAATENGSTGSYRKFCTISIPSMYTPWWCGTNNDFDGAAECTGRNLIAGVGPTHTLYSQMGTLLRIGGAETVHVNFSLHVDGLK